MQQDGFFTRFGPASAAAAGLLGLGYSISFSLYLHSPSRGTAYADAILLLVGGLVSSAAFTALYERLRPTDPGLALWGFSLALVGAFAAAIHGAYDLANLSNPPAELATDLPSSIDPRGLGTFAFTGLAVAIAGTLILRGRRLPRGLGYLALVAAALLVFVYVGRLVILDPKSPALLAAAVAVGYVVDPVWFVWLAVALRRQPVGAVAPMAPS
jgi:Domain of unknown function (DUF4386)